MSVYFVSDTHFGHGNIIKYCSRPFMTESEQQLLADKQAFRVSRESVERMDSIIIDNINSVVKPEDTLWHLGDFAFSDYKAARRYRDRIHCRKMNLVWGNHDRAFLRDLFDDCYAQGGGGNGSDVPEPLVVDGQYIWLNHYPCMSWDGSNKGCWMLHGHVHGNIRKNPVWRAVYDLMLICDVGVDGPCVMAKEKIYNHTFTPWSMAELRNFMKFKQTMIQEVRTI